MPIKMKDLPEAERPYEKLEQYGAKALTNAELLAIIIKTGTKDETAVGLAQKVLKLNTDEKDNLKFLCDLTVEEFTKIKGIGKIKAIQLKAVCELATRINSVSSYKEKQILRPKDIAEILMERTRFEKQEILKVAMLNNKNKLIRIKEIAKGGGNFVAATIRSILNEAVKIEAAKIILIHNHPTGDPTPSKQDIEFTKNVEQASKILEIQLLDHIVIGDLKYVSIFSMREKQKEADEKGKK
ncbi:dNA repair protein RadC [Clostridium sp. CAG:356]|nr:dNA repair protein RadC [Clostridium sp. CAG:356]